MSGGIIDGGLNDFDVVEGLGVIVVVGWLLDGDCEEEVLLAELYGLGYG